MNDVLQLPHARTALRILRRTARSQDLRRVAARLGSAPSELFDLPGWAPDADGLAAVEGLLADCPEPGGPSLLDVAVKGLADRLALTDTEAGILSLVAAFATDPTWQDLGSWLLDLPRPLLTDALAVGLDRPRAEVVEALAPQGALFSLELLTEGHEEFARSAGLSLGFLVRRIAADPERPDPLAGWVTPVRPSALSASDFAHVAADVDRVGRVLRAAARERTVGFNVLFLGPPGTGKSELARVLASEVGGAAFDVGSESPNRLSTWLVAQRVAARIPASIVVFDECEDALVPDEDLWNQHPKHWFTHHLDEHPVPTLWVANQLSGLDPALYRRFDVVLHLERPPAAARRRVVDASIGDLPLSDAVRAGLASDPRIAPGHLARAGRALRLLAPSDAAEAEAAVRAFLQPLLAPVGPRPAPATSRPYDPTVPTATHDLVRLADGLAARGRGAILAYGPPGTGKTGWARFVAERSGKPLLSRTASDLLAPLVGLTEANVAAAFREAEERGAVLLLDEVDTFLRGRDRAERGYEVSLVNEVLARLDDFGGVVICTTNRVDDLDAAALRRFAVHVGFDAPGPDGRVRLLGLALDRLGLPLDDDARAWAVSEPLVPGTLDAACREVELFGAPTFAALQDAVSRRRSPGQRPIVGFGASSTRLG